jgi:hypothetical protein
MRVLLGLRIGRFRIGTAGLQIGPLSWGETRMPSPFPGMDPYLENSKTWPVFQQQLILCLHQTLQPGLMDRYRARINQRHYFNEQALFTSVVREEHVEEFIEIRQRSDGRLVTLIEVVSPTNKTTAAGRQAYLDRRRASRGASLVEIDLLLQGQPMLEYSRDKLEKWDDAVTLTRAASPDRHEIYTTTLQKPLTRFRLPLSPDDRDTVLDLQTIFTRCYDHADFAGKIDYKSDPPVAVPEEDRKWIATLLIQKKLRD